MEKAEKEKLKAVGRVSLGLSVSRSPRELGEEAEPFHLSIGEADLPRRGLTLTVVYHREVNWSQNGRQVRMMDQAYGELMRVCLPEY